METAGIAPACHIPQVILQHDPCVDDYTPCLHLVCTDAALQELVANWQRLMPEVRAAIMELVHCE
jgi:hypothetical protein